MARGKRGLTANEALDLVPDDLPDGAFFAMAAEMYGDDYGDFFDALVAEDTAPRPNKKRAEKKIQCGGCKKWFASKHAQRQHAKAKGHKPA